MSEMSPLLPGHLPPKADNGKYVLAIHGGAGTMSKEGSIPKQQTQYKDALRASLATGYQVLRGGGEAMDAAVAAVTVLEDCPLFNAGKGAVFNVDGKNELEASIMLSKPPLSDPHIPPSRRGLGLTLLTRVKNPSQLIRSLYLSPSLVPHAFLSGSTAEYIGEALGEQLVDPSYFFTERRWKEHRRGLGLPDEPLPASGELADEKPEIFCALDQMPMGTVGAVALDSRGCIAVVTSTGGKTNKLVGRIGDTPMMGAGFWAQQWSTTGWVRRTWNRVRRQPKHSAVGVSGTGDGDYFIRLDTASTIACRMKHLHEPLKKAARYAVEELRLNGGIGGVIAIDHAGNVEMPLNCPGMYRGLIREDGVPKTAIFAEDMLS